MNALLSRLQFKFSTAMEQSVASCTECVCMVSASQEQIVDRRHVFSNKCSMYACFLLLFVYILWYSSIDRDVPQADQIFLIKAQ